jgi:hypothetical protein
MSRQVTAAVLVAALLLGFTAPSGHAAEADGCAGQAASFADDGAPLGTAAAPGEGGTREDPLPVDWDGPVQWSGTTEAVLQDGTTTVVLAPASSGLVLGAAFEAASRGAFGGDFTNEDGDTEREGRTTLANYSLGVPLMTGTYSVELVMTAGAGTCTGLGYLTVTDSPVGSVLFWVAAGLLLLGLALAVFARPTARRART